MRNLRIFAALSLAFGSLLIAQPAQAASTGPVQITCEKNGTQGTYQVAWDNSNQFFEGKGNIAALYCTGGFSPLGAGATYVSDTLTNESLRYYNGVIPEPVSESPTVSPDVSQSPTVSDSASVSESPSTVSPEPSPTDSSTVSPESTTSPTTSPTPESSSSEPVTASDLVQSGSQQVTVSPEPTSSPESTASPTPTVWEYTVPEGSILSASAPAGMMFSGAIARYQAYDTDCGITVSDIVAAAFNGTTHSSISATNDVFGDPCPGWYKKLEVSFLYVSSPVTEPVSSSPSISPEPVQPTPTPEPQPTPTPEPVVQPQPTPEPVIRPEPTPEPTPQPTPDPQPEPEPTPVPEPTDPPIEPQEPNPQPNPEPEPVRPEPTPLPQPIIPDPRPEPVPSKPEPVPPVVPQPTPNPEPSKPPISELLQNISTVNPTSLTEAQVTQLVEAALTVFQNAEQGSPEYEAALEALAIAAEADDLELSEELAAVPLLGDVAGAALEILNDLGNVGADMSPQVREQSEKVVIAAVIVGQVAMTATAAAASAAAAAARRP